MYTAEVGLRDIGADPDRFRQRKHVDDIGGETIAPVSRTRDMMTPSLGAASWGHRGEMRALSLFAVAAFAWAAAAAMSSARFPSSRSTKASRADLARASAAARLAFAWSSSACEIVPFGRSCFGAFIGELRILKLRKAFFMRGARLGDFGCAGPGL